MPTVQFPDKFSRLPDALSCFGLSIFGSFVVSQADCPSGRNELTGGDAVLIGNAGPQMWVSFSQSPEYSDGEISPMDRWTERVLSEVASGCDAQAIFPFEKPYWPFQRFAERSGHARSSPLGIYIHPEYGLWHAFRGALIWPASSKSQFAALGSMATTETHTHPCEVCEEKPCLSACPVNAFDGITLDRDACHGHLASGSGPYCSTVGCRARDSCPIGSSYRYCEEQIQFHMRAFAPGIK